MSHNFIFSFACSHSRNSSRLHQSSHLGLHFSTSSNGRMVLLYISSLLPSTCLISLTSHLHLCGLGFVHPFINVVRLLYIVIEKEMNQFFSSSQATPANPFHFLTSQHLSHNLFNEVFYRVWAGPTVLWCTQHTLRDHCP